MNSFFCNVLWKQSFTNVLENRCSYKFRKFHKKAPMLVSLFNKVFKNIFFYTTPPAAASVVFAAKQLNIQCYKDNFGLILKIVMEIL